MTTAEWRVSAVVVSFNVEKLLAQCLRSLQAANIWETIVIDSSSTDDSAAMVRRHFPDARLKIVPNRGYGAGVNAGLKLASGDLVFILNPDTIVLPTAVNALRNALIDDQRLGLVGPRLLYPDGAVQSSRRRFPTQWTPIFESTILEEWFPDNRWVRHYRRCESDARIVPVQSVDWLVGAALMVKRQVVDQVGGFDEEFFLYGEEIEWCYRIKRHGWRNGYVSDATVIHHESASTGQNRLANRLEFDRGRVRAQLALHGPKAARRSAQLLRLNYALMLGREAVKWAIGHRRELRRNRMAMYWRLLSSSLHE